MGRSSSSFATICSTPRPTTSPRCQFPRPSFAEISSAATSPAPSRYRKLYNGRDRTFFQLSLESYRQVSGTTATGIVPTALERDRRLQSIRSRRHAILFSQSKGEHQGIVRSARAARRTDARSGCRLFVPCALRQDPQHRPGGKEPPRLLPRSEPGCGARQS